jgi:MFS family permease
MRGAEHQRASPLAWYALGVLTLVNFFAYVDRQVLLLLAEPIRKTLVLSDLQVGLLQGTGIAVFTSLASYPLGWLADRYDRRWVLAGCVAVWSAAVVACGMATSYGQLLFASAMVGAGEAGLAPIVYALIPLLFVGRQRQVANSIFAVTALGGGALALAVTGQLIGFVETVRPWLPESLRAVESWRLSFFAAALPAPLMMLLVLTLSVPAKGTTAVADSPAPATVIPILPYLRRHRATFLSFHIGVALGGFSFGAVIVWLAVVCARVFSESPAQIGAALGTGQLASAGLAFVLSIGLLRWLQARLGVRVPVRVMWIAMLCAVPLCLGLLAAKTAFVVYAIYAAYGTCLSLAVMCYPTALQSLAPAPLRGRVAAIQGMVTMAGAAAAPPLVGWLSDRLQHLPNGLIVAIVSVAVPSLLLSAALLWWCERQAFEKTVAEATQLDA